MTQETITAVANDPAVIRVILNDSVNPALLQLTKDITITSKTSITTLVKTVDDVNDSRQKIQV